MKNQKLLNLKGSSKNTIQIIQNDDITNVTPVIRHRDAVQLKSELIKPTPV